MNVTFVPAVAKVGILTSEDKARIREVQDLHKDRLHIPRRYGNPREICIEILLLDRPPWTPDMSAEQIDQQERVSFLEWRRKLAL